MSRKDKKREFRYLKGLKGRMQSSLSGFLRACVVALLVLFQFAILLVLPLLLREYSSLFYVIMEVMGVLTILALTNDNRIISYKFAWLCIIVVLPISGNIMYVLWGKVGKRNKLNRKIKAQIKKVDHYLVQDKEVAEQFAKNHPVSSRMSRYMQAQGSPLFKNNKASYFDMGEDAFESIFADLENAKKFILIDFFIVAEGALWDKMHEILKRKVEEGVEVKFLYDDFGSLIRTGKDFASNLRKEGIEVEIFNPISKYISKLFMNFRNHQKIIVIDGNIGYTGGFNLADEYANLVDRFGGIWKDAGIRLTGEAVWGLTITFFELWTVCAGKDMTNYDRYRPNMKLEETDMYCHVLRDGPALDTRSFVGSVYKQMINFADKKMYIMTPYLILSEGMVEALIESVHRGVDVRIITPYVPDKKHIKEMTEYNYGILLKNGVRIFEYVPGFIHSKVVLNEHSVIVGSINMDYRSLYLHYENGVWVYDKEFLKEAEEDFTNTFMESKEITYLEWKNRPWKKKIMQAVLHVFDTLV